MFDTDLYCKSIVQEKLLKNSRKIKLALYNSILLESSVNVLVYLVTQTLL